MSYDYRFKLIIIGETGTGKSCLVRQYTEPNYYFENVHDVTIGVDFSVKMSNIEINDKKYNIKTQIWDTAGQETFRSITASYYRNTAAILLVFDLGNRQSFNKIDYWISQIERNATHNPPIFLIGNKTDLFNKRVSSNEAMTYASNNKLTYIETSAKDNEKVIDMFTEVNKSILKNVLESDKNIEGVFTDFRKSYIEDNVDDYNCRECCLIS